MRLLSRTVGAFAFVLLLPLVSQVGGAPGTAPGSTGSPPEAPAATARTSISPPNIVLVNTDDQRWDTLEFMPSTLAELAASGTTFTNAFVPTVMCCPSRVSILSGKYSHTHGVLSQGGSLGGYLAYDDSGGVAQLMSAAGYRTGLFGKYVNGYPSLGLPYDTVPPGWDRWFAAGRGYYDWTANDDGAVRRFGSAPEDYSTDVLASELVDFIEGSVADGTPFFGYLAPLAPHLVRGLPPPPAPRHESAFADLEPLRLPSFNEADVSDKPAFIQRTPLLSDEAPTVVDDGAAGYLESGAGWGPGPPGMGGSSRVSADPAAAARWATGGLTGPYMVEVAKVVDPAASPEVLVTVTGASTETARFDGRVGNSGWISIAKVEFTGAAEEGVRLENAAGAGTLIADAVRFVRVKSTAEIDLIRQRQLESLLAVDDAVATVVTKLRDLGVLGQTVIVFTSDNGYMWGEHRLHAKGRFYDESARVPLIIRDGRHPVARTEGAFALNIDVVPTILELAGLAVPPDVDGISLAPMLSGPAGAGRTAFIFESWGPGPSAEGLRTREHLYIEHPTGERELYELAADPYQMESIHDDPERGELLTILAAQLDAVRSPDRDPPAISSLAVEPQVVFADDAILEITADISDLGLGDSAVKTPEFFVDVTNRIGWGYRMVPADGSFDQPTEEVVAVAVNLGGPPPERPQSVRHRVSGTLGRIDPGPHTVYVRARDASNFGPFATAEFEVLDPTATYGGKPTNPAGVGYAQGRFWFGPGHEAQRGLWTLEDGGDRAWPLGSEAVAPAEFVEFAGKVIFVATRSDGQRELWASHGTGETTRRFRNLSGSVSSDPGELTVFDGRLFFVAARPDGQRELWVSDGTVGGTGPFRNLSGGVSSDPGELTVFDGRLFFVGAWPDGQRELWVSDGSTAGTRAFTNMFGASSSDPAELTAGNTRMAFTAAAADGRRTLFATGSVPGTVAAVIPEDWSYTELRGAWQDSSDGGHAGGPVRVSADPDASARWVPQGPAGRYNVSIYKPDGVNQSTAVRVSVRHRDGVNATTIDYAGTPPGWVDLGTFWFIGPGEGWVRVLNDAGGVLATDAVRFENAAPPRLRLGWPLDGVVRYGFAGPQTAPIRVARYAAVVAPASAQWDGAVLEAAITAGAESDDRVEIAGGDPNARPVAVRAGEVFARGQPIGAVSGGTGGEPLVITFSSGADRRQIRWVLQSLTYRSVAAVPGTAPRSVRISLTDPHGHKSDPVLLQLLVRMV